MTGPPYPRYAPGAGPGQNAIGSFVIGVSPLGTISAFDVWTTVISQYANSAILTRLVTDFAQYVDQTKDFDQFFDLMWNVDTAQGYGLDAIGRKVNASRTVNVPGDRRSSASRRRARRPSAAVRSSPAAASPATSCCPTRPTAR
jgi:hypothetical protein